MKLNLEKARYYSGLGDLVMLAWLATGAAKAGLPLSFHRRRDLELLSLFTMSIDPTPGGLSLDPVFDIELADHGRQVRLAYIRDYLKLDCSWERPTVNIPAEATQWADETVRDVSQPLVLLFPQTVWKTREWPANYWVEIAWKLKAMGYAVMLMYQGDDQRFQNTPLYFWNMPFARIAALMMKAQLVIGNDSFPAHMAGTLGVPTIALMGPTKPTVFGHIPNVTCLTSTLDCTGCHFREPFRAACDQGCLSLYRLFPEAVLHQAVHMLTAAAK